MWRTEDIHHTDHRGSRPNRKKYIGDDTKAATRQSLNCIKNKKINKIYRKQIINMADGILHPATWHDHDIDFAR